jgi:AcrR family transcriptional regulator
MSERAAPRRRRRDEVLQAAADLFFEKGYEATSTADIAERVGILRGSVYYYLETKEALLFELLEGVFAGFLSALAEIQTEECDALEKLRRVVGQHVKYLADNLVRTTLFLTESRSLSIEHRAVVLEQEEEYRSALVDLIAGGQRERTIRGDVSPEIVAMAIVGAANWVHRWYWSGGNATADEIARQFEIILTEGLAP